MKKRLESSTANPWVGNGNGRRARNGSLGNGRGRSSTGRIDSQALAQAAAAQSFSVRPDSAPGKLPAKIQADRRQLELQLRLEPPWVNPTQLECPAFLMN